MISALNGSDPAVFVLTLAGTLRFVLGPPGVGGGVVLDISLGGEVRPGPSNPDPV